MIKNNCEEFLDESVNCPIFDVRSPAEYQHAHIPGAFSLPIFSNEERKEIGTTYKQIGREQAIKIGLGYFGKKMLNLVEKAELILKENDNRTKRVAVHCWRGGMRSAALAWLLDLYGFEVFLLEGGYKSYRNWVLLQFEKTYTLKIVSGYTGSNKTGIIHKLLRENHCAIDLEQLACHKGSAFGKLGMPEAPSQEQFENLLAQKLAYYHKQNASANIWLEDESQRIGTVNIPPGLFKQMRSHPIYFLDIPFEERLKFIVETYGIHEKKGLRDGIERIQKKLGGPESREALSLLEEGNLKDCFAILLKYYDRLYIKSSLKRKDAETNIIVVESSSTNPEINLKHLLNHVRN